MHEGQRTFRVVIAAAAVRMGFVVESCAGRREDNLPRVVAFRWGVSLDCQPYVGRDVHLPEIPRFEEKVFGLPGVERIHQTRDRLLLPLLFAEQYHQRLMDPVVRLGRESVGQSRAG